MGHVHYVRVAAENCVGSSTKRVPTSYSLALFIRSHFRYNVYMTTTLTQDVEKPGMVSAGLDYDGTLSRSAEAQTEAVMASEDPIRRAVWEEMARILEERHPGTVWTVELG